MVTFNPSSIPLSNPPLYNPWTSQYWWAGSGFLPVSYEGPVGGMTPTDAYARFTWHDFETSKGVYNWTLVDNLLAKAAAGGGRGWFRLIAVSTSEGGTNVPAYLVNEAGGFFFNGNWIPDWNSEGYLSNLERVLTDIGSRYRPNPRWGGLDMSSYGNYGEWHEFGSNATDTTTLTLPNARRIIDANYAAVGGDGSRLLMSASYTDAAVYAFQKDAAIGFRTDGLGLDAGMGGYVDAWTAIAASYPAFWDRWKYGRGVAEWGTHSGGISATTYAQPEVLQYHLTMLGSGNTTFADPQSQWVDTFKLAGARMRVQSATVGTLTAGSSATVTVQWQNDGNAPPYGRWTVYHQLLNMTTGAIVHEHASGLVFSSVGGAAGVLPTAGSAVSRTDTWTLPSGLATGTYTYALQVRDNDGVTAPWALATTGRNSAGAYPLGTVSVSGATPVTPPAAPTDAYGGAVYSLTPTAYYRLDEASGTVLTATLGQDGTFTGTGVTHAATGLLSGNTDKATTFDGAAGAASAPLDLSATSQITIEFLLSGWAFADDDHLTLEFGNPFQAINGFLVDLNSSWEHAIEISVGDGSGVRVLGGKTARPGDTATHAYAFTIDRRAGAIQAYVDGNPQAVTLSTPGSVQTSFASDTLYLMSRGMTSLFGAGTLDEVAIYPTILSAAAIANHAASALGSVPTPPTPSATRVLIFTGT